MVTDKIALMSADIDLVLNRLHNKLNTKSDRGLSLKLGLSESAIAVSKNKKAIPYSAIVLTCLKYSISIDEVFDNHVEIKNSDYRESRNDSNTIGYSADKLLEVCNEVERILGDVLVIHRLPPDRVLMISNKLRPLLIKAAFENEFNYLFVKASAEGALMMA
jgi:hypothetical protein